MQFGNLKAWSTVGRMTAAIPIEIETDSFQNFAPISYPLIRPFSISSIQNAKGSNTTQIKKKRIQLVNIEIREHTKDKNVTMITCGQYLRFRFE